MIVVGLPEKVLMPQLNEPAVLIAPALVIVRLSPEASIPNLCGPLVLIIPDAVTVTLPEPPLFWVVSTVPVTVMFAAKDGTAVNPPNASKLTRKYLTGEGGMVIYLLIIKNVASESLDSLFIIALD